MQFFLYDGTDGIDGPFMGRNAKEVVDGMRSLFKKIVDSDWSDAVDIGKESSQDEAAWKAAQLDAELRGFRAGLVRVAPTGPSMDSWQPVT
jgi:hypothetical protein